jgi:hypothetical protein
MPDILVRKLPKETVTALKKIAKNGGISMAELVRKAVDEIVLNERRHAALARTDALRANMGKIWKGPTVLDMLREDRDRR